MKPVSHRHLSVAATMLAMALVLAPIVSEAGSTKPKKPVADYQQQVGTGTAATSAGSLTPDALATYCENRLNGTDAAVNQQLGKQNKKGNCGGQKAVLNKSTGDSVSQGTELQMIQLQQVTSQRQQAAQTTTGLVQGKQCQPCLNKIGN